MSNFKYAKSILRDKLRSSFTQLSLRTSPHSQQHHDIKMQFSTITAICATLAVTLAAPQVNNLSVGNLQVVPTTDSVGNLQVVPASIERVVTAAPAPGAEGFLACNVESDCVLKKVTAACGGTTTRCMNKQSPATLGAQTGFGICLMDPPGPDSCSCQQNKCFGIMRRPSYLGSNDVPQ